MSQFSPTSASVGRRSGNRVTALTLVWDDNFYDLLSLDKTWFLDAPLNYTSTSQSSPTSASAGRTRGNRVTALTLVWDESLETTRITCYPWTHYIL